MLNCESFRGTSPRLRHSRYGAGSRP
jgi:hypothetical protein